MTLNTFNIVKCEVVVRIHKFSVQYNVGAMYSTVKLFKWDASFLHFWFSIVIFFHSAFFLFQFSWKGYEIQFVPSGSFLVLKKELYNS